jgi:hypothetical protein
MKPVLQLARPFLMKVSFGEIQPVSFDSNMWVFKSSHSLEDGVSNDDNQYRRRMSYFSRHHRIYFSNTLQ